MKNSHLMYYGESQYENLIRHIGETRPDISKQILQNSDFWEVLGIIAIALDVELDDTMSINSASKHLLTYL